MSKVKCTYCGAIIDEIYSNNPWDNGLHPEYNKYTDENPRYCCSKCNTVTIINRHLADMIHGQVYENKIMDPYHTAALIRLEADYIEKNAEELGNYYSNVRQNM